jgi:hypothetical protein
MEHAQSQQSSALPAVRAIEALAMSAGWPTAEAFIVAMLLVGHGCTVVEAEAAFQHARRVVQ